MRVHSNGLALGLAAALLLFGVQSPGESPGWPHWARQVGQSESSRQQALRELRKINGLDEKLLKALDGSQRALALDVIVAQKSTSLIPQLLLRVPEDEDGFLVLCLNTLINKENKDQIFTIYEELLKSPNQKKSSAGALVALLEPLGRLGHPISKDAVSALLRHEYPEVRSAALSYVRLMSLEKGNHAYLSFVRKAATSQPYQLRLQAYHLLSELHDQVGVNPPISAGALASLCKGEKKEFIRKPCYKTVQKLRGDRREL